MGEFSYIQTELAHIHPFTLPVCDKDENQEIESIEPSLGEGNALSHYQQMENIQKDESGPRKFCSVTAATERLNGDPSGDPRRL